MNLRQYPIYFHVFISTYYKYIYKYIHLCTSMLLCLLRCLFFLVYRVIIHQLCLLHKGVLLQCFYRNVKLTAPSIVSHPGCPLSVLVRLTLSLFYLGLSKTYNTIATTLSPILFSLIFLFCKR